MKHFVTTRLCAALLLCAMLLSSLLLSGCGLIDFFRSRKGGSAAADGTTAATTAPLYTVPEGDVYYILYDLAGGTFDGPTWYTPETEDFVIGKPTREGYDFDGWTEAGQSGMGKGFLVRKGTRRNLLLTAHWTPISYTLTLDPDGGSVDDVPATYTIESDAIALPRPARIGYVFIGWTGPGIDGYEKNVTVPHGSTGDRTYVACWADKPMGLEFSATADEAEIDYAVSEDGDVVTLIAPVLSGAFRFVCWKENSVEISRSPILTFEPFGIQVLSAVYEELPVLTYDRAAGGSVSFTAKDLPTAVFGGGARYEGSVCDVTMSSRTVEFKADYLATLEPGWYDFCVTSGMESEWFRLRVTAGGVRNLKIDYDTDLYPAAVLVYDCDCGGTHTCSLDGGAAFVCHSGDVLEGYDKSRSHTVRVTCADTGASAVCTKAGWTNNSRSSYESTFTFAGHTWDRVAEDKDEFAAMMAYFALVYGIIEYDAGRNDVEQTFWATGDLAAELYDRDASSRLYKETFAAFSLPMAPRYATSADTEGKCTVTFMYGGVCETPSAYERAPIADTQGLLTESGRGEAFEAFAIDALTETVTVRTVFELELLPWGKKPVFDDTPLSQAAKEVYDAARDVLRRYVSDDMNDYEKVSAIYAWLGLNVTYDHYAASAADAPHLRAFTAYGALVDRLAVCDGFGSALRLMCQIEGIEAEEVTGLKDDYVVNSGHAWNKVSIDGVWYGVDATWAGSSGRYVTMRFLFMPEDAFVLEGHYECYCSDNNVASRYTRRCSVSPFSWYDLAAVSLGVDHHIGSREELLRLVNAATAAGIDKLEVICDGSDDTFRDYLQFVVEAKGRGYTYISIEYGDRYIINLAENE